MTPQGMRGREHVGVLLAGALLAVAATWPLVLHLGDLTRMTDRTLDDYVGYWNFRWVYRALFELHVSPFFNPEIFVPHGVNVATSPLGFVFGLFSIPFQALMGGLPGAVLTLKLVAFLSFPLAVHGMTGFLRSLRVPLLVAFLGACLFAFVPFRFIQLTRPHYLTSFFLPYACWLLILAVEGRRVRTLLGAGVLIAVAGGSDASILPEIALAGAALWWLLCRRGAPAWPTLGRITLAGVVATALLSPLLVFFVAAERDGSGLDVASDLLFTGAPSPRQAVLSPDLSSTLYYLSPSLHEASMGDEGWQREPGREIRAIYTSFRPQADSTKLERVMAVGTILLVALAAAWGLGRRSSWPFAVLAVVGFLLALGPYRQIGGEVVRMPWYWLSRVVPGMEAQRYTVVILRSFHFGLVVVATLGLARSWRWLGPAAWTLLVLTAVVWVGRPVRFAPLVPDEAHRVIAADDAPGSVLELPFDELGMRRMALGQVVHERPMTLGPISRVPAETLAFVEQSPVVRRFISPLLLDRSDPEALSATAEENVRLLRDAGVRWVLVRRPFRRTGDADQIDALPAYLALHDGLRVAMQEDDLILIRVDDA